MSAEEKWDQWASWLGTDPVHGTIYKDIVDMRASRQVWESFQKVIEESPPEAKKFAIFHSWVNGGYVRSQGLGIRRQTDGRTDVVSLVRLLRDVRDCPDVLTEESILRKDARWGIETRERVLRGSSARDHDRRQRRHHAILAVGLQGAVARRGGLREGCSGRERRGRTSVGARVVADEGIARSCSPC